LDGHFILSGISAGTHNLTVKYVGYSSLTITGVVVKPGLTVQIEVPMASSSQELNEVVVVAEMKRENTSSLLLMQKKSATVQDGISAESIRRTPDKSTSEVVKRVSGASVQEGKFVIIRGLNDRYNGALLNGVPLASTEPDRKAFSFDLFPANLLDNLIVVKTASPDLPGEFAGGLLQVNTKDIPDERFFKFTAGTGYNAQSTFKEYGTYQGGKTDWLGSDDGTRALPASFPSTEVLQSANAADRYSYSKQLPNDWAGESKSSSPLFQSHQLSFGDSKEFGKDRFGYIGALTYSNSRKAVFTERSDFDFDGQQNFLFNDNQYRSNVFWGGLLNLTYRAGEKSKFSLKNLVSRNANDLVIDRTGADIENAQDIRANAFWYNSTTFMNSSLSGDHALGSEGIKADWNIAYTRLAQTTPDLRRMLYYRDSYAGPEDTSYYAYVPFGTASPNYAGKFYSNLGEDNYSGQFNLTIPLVRSGRSHTLKAGGLGQIKDRSFDARVLGYVVANAGQFDWSLLQRPVEDLFTADHMSPNGFRLDEITNPSDSYVAGSTLLAAYVMMDDQITDKLRAVWGLRAESFHQQLSSFGYSNEPVEVDTKVLDLLPSVNLTYSLTEKTNLRAAASRTVARPEFRELAPFTFYDFVNATSVAGNAAIVRSRIDNYDLRYEFFPTPGEILSASLFYKNFDSPIEPFVECSGAGSRRICLLYAKSAYVVGVETEWRKRLDFAEELLSWSQWENLSLTGNIALMKSRADVSNDLRSDGARPLQGQSPYVVNMGLTYQHPVNGLGLSVAFNRIGKRIFQVGNQGYYDILEAPRSVVDLQVSKRLFGRGEIRFSVNDLLNQSNVFYQDLDRNGSFDRSGDAVIASSVFGTNLSLSFTYGF
ncbi:MAG: TonB-dependent receptor domain-containing protein, partial [Bacteroidota bacterium]